MKNQIKNARVKNLVANKCKSAIEGALSIFSCEHQIEVEKRENWTNIIISSRNQDDCSIITRSEIEEVIEAIKPYTDKYYNVDYHFDAKKVYNGHIDRYDVYPVIVVCVQISPTLWNL